MSFNIFTRVYRTEENYWTEALLKFLANTNSSAALARFFRKLGLLLRVGDWKDITFEMQLSKGDSVPDATIGNRNTEFMVHIESKKGLGFNARQAENHLLDLRGYAGRGTKALIVITDDAVAPPRFLDFAREHAHSKIQTVFASWHSIQRSVEALAATAKGDKVLRFLASRYSLFIKEEVMPERTEWDTSHISERCQDAARLRREVPVARFQFPVEGVGKRQTLY